MDKNRLGSIFAKADREKRQMVHKIFIVVEGQKTEYEYIEKLVKYRYSNIAPQIIFECNNCFNNISTLLTNKSWTVGVDKAFVLSDFDRAYDKDKTDAQKRFREGYTALSENLGEGIITLFSNPTFEYWIYLHVENNFIVEQVLCDAGEIVGKIAKKVKTNLKKNEKRYEGLYCKIGEDTFFGDKVMTASQRSIQQMEHHQISCQQKIDKYPRKFVFTMVGKLIDELEQIKDVEIYNPKKYINNRYE